MASNIINYFNVTTLYYIKMINNTPLRLLFRIYFLKIKILVSIYDNHDGNMHHPLSFYLIVSGKLSLNGYHRK